MISVSTRASKVVDREDNDEVEPKLLTKKSDCVT